MSQNEPTTSPVPDTPPAPPVRVGQSAAAFALCAGIGIAAGGIAYLALARTGLHMDRIAFFTIVAFAVAHVGAILILGPRFEARNRGSQRGIAMLAAIVWTVTMALTVGATLAWQGYRARTAAKAEAVEVARTDAILTAGGWHRTVLDAYVPFMDVDHLGELVVAIGGVQAGTILTSADHGSSWSRLDLPPHVNTLWRVRVVAPDRIYVLAMSEERGPLLLTSRDGGASWNEQAAPVDGREIHCSTPDRCWLLGNSDTAELRIFATIDGGGNWTPEHLEPAPADPIQYTTPHCTAGPNPESPLCFAALGDSAQGHGGFVLRRLAGGGGSASWSRTDLSATLRRWNDAWSGDGVILAAGGTAVETPKGEPSIRSGILMRSDDGGASFHEIPFGIPPGSAPVGLDFVSATRIFAIVGDGLLRSDDGGATFVADATVTAYAGLGTTYMRDLAFSADDRGVVIKENGSMIIKGRLDQ